MKRNSRLLALVLALVMIVSATPAMASEWKNSDTYPLSSEHTFQVATMLSAMDLNDTYADLLLEKYLGLSTEWLHWDEEQISLSFASGDLPDIGFRTWMDKSIMYEYGQGGKLVNFMDYIDIMPNLQKVWEINPNAKKLAMNEDGSVYALTTAGRGLLAAGNLIYARNDMLATAGWDHQPETVEEFLQCLKDVQAANADVEGFYAWYPQNANQMAWSGNVANTLFPAFGEILLPSINIDDESGTVTFGAATEQWKQYLKYMNEVYNSGAFYKGIYEEDGTASKAAILSNKVAFSNYMTVLTPDNFASGELDFTVMKPMTSQNWDTKHWKNYGSTSWIVFFVTTDCPDIEAACKWLDALYAGPDNTWDEEGTMWGVATSWGQLGVDYTLDYENMTYTILPHEGYDSSSAWVNTAMLNGYCSWGGEDGLFLEDNGGAKTGLAVKGEGTRDNLFPYAEDYVDISLLSMTEDESMDYADYWTDLDNYIGEMTAAFITGNKDIDAEWDNYLKELDAMGLGEVCAIYEAAYARSLANK